MKRRALPLLDGFHRGADEPQVHMDPPKHERLVQDARVILSQPGQVANRYGVPVEGKDSSADDRSPLHGSGVSEWQPA